MRPTSFETRLHDCIRDLLVYCRERNWAGYDPYDALNSRVFARIPLSGSKLARLAFTQFMKRSPVNLRRWLQVPKQQNPKGLALFISALVKLTRRGLADSEEVKTVVARLLELRSAGWDRYCWGYNFDWQTRTYLVPQHEPNIICTTFAGNALLDAYEEFGQADYLEAALSAGRFLLENLNRTGDDTESCFSYTPLDRSRIHNANLLGAAFLTRLHAQRNCEAFLKQALASVQFSVRRQRADGAWFYGEDRKQRWIDSFHTGYNLAALETIRQCASDDGSIEASIRKGFDFFLGHFFTSDGIVKYYHDRTYPIDVHAIAQAIITLVRLRHYSSQAIALAQRVCDWALNNMQMKNGAFMYQQHRVYNNRIQYMRWGQAWMLLAMVSLAKAVADAGEKLNRVAQATMGKTESGKRKWARTTRAETILCPAGNAL